MDKKRLLIWELAGFLFISVLGSLHHFTFEWAGYWRPLALIAPVNESTWEHLKMAFFPGLVFALVEWRMLRQTAPNFIVAKTASLYLMPLLISLIFYAYTAFVRSSLLPNVASFLVAVGVGQWVSYRLLTAPPLSRVWGWVALAALVILLAAFLSLTFFAPPVFLFVDPVQGSYGLLP